MEQNALNLSRDILGCLISHPESFTDVLDGDIFDLRDHKEIFLILKRLKKEGVAWDLSIVYHNAPEILRPLINELTQDSNNLIACPFLLGSYLTSLEENRLLSVVEELKLQYGTTPLLFAEKVREKALSIKRESKTKHIKSYFNDLFKQIEKASEAPTAITGVPSGFKTLDKITWGFQPQRLYLIAGRPSMGKSAFGMNISHNAALAGKSVFIQSLEESAQSLTNRMLSKATGIETERLTRGQLKDTEWSRVSSTVENISSLSIIIDESVGVSSSKICQAIQKEHSKSKLDLIVIDHIQQIRETAQNRHLELSQAAFNLKELAKDLNLPIVVMCQLNRGVELRSDKHPSLSDLKESGDLEAIADVVMLLYRQAYYEPDCLDKSKVELSIAKNRDGRTGTVLLSWNPEIMSFSNYY